MNQNGKTDSVECEKFFDTDTKNRHIEVHPNDSKYEDNTGTYKECPIGICEDFFRPFSK